MKKPVLVLGQTGDCYGILQYFARCLAKSFRELGIECVTDVEGSGLSVLDILKQDWAAVIGIENPNIWSDWINYLKCSKYQFWFDDPVFSADKFMKMGKCTVLSLDYHYTDFINGNYSDKKAFFIPPGGRETTNSDREREYDVSFLGTYFPVVGELTSEQHRFFQFMMEHHELTFEEGMEQFYFISRRKEPILFDEFITYMRESCYMVAHYYREQVVKAIITSGTDLHVFGNSWKLFPCKNEHLIIHAEVRPDDMISIYQNSKISLNIMRWHKAGMTERIAESMLAEAVCVSDETKYLKENFVDGENIILYSLEQLDEMVLVIKNLLNDTKKREKIAKSGYKCALENHTWKKRAEQLLELINLDLYDATS